MTNNINERASEIVEQAIANLVNLGCSTDDALRMLVLQAAIRLPHDEALRMLQEYSETMLRQALEGPPPPIIN